MEKTVIQIARIDLMANPNIRSIFVQFVNDMAKISLHAQTIARNIAVTIVMY